MSQTRSDELENPKDLEASRFEHSNSSEATPNRFLNDTTSPEPDRLIGTVFVDRYQITELIGRGGMGTVYKATSLVNNEVRAIKILDASHFNDGDELRRLEVESNAARRIKHPNAVKIFDVGVSKDGRMYLVMEFIDGISLADLLKTAHRLAVRDAIKIFVQICGVLSEAHLQGVVHRDLKPSNILITDQPGNRFTVKLVDFGIAKVFPAAEEGTYLETASGKVIGSPPYMSPEQCLGQKIDFRTDIYSLGCLMYEVLSGAPPLLGPTPMSTMYRHVNDVPRPLKSLDEDIRLVHILDQIISKAMSKAPNQRQTSVEELQQSLEAAFNSFRKKSTTISAVQQWIRAAKHDLLGKPGSSTRNILIAATITSAIAIFAGLVVSPIITAKVPPASELELDWRPLPITQKVDQILGFKFEDEDKALRAKIEEDRKNSESYSPESLALCEELAELHYNNQAIETSAALYNQVLTEGLTLFKVNYKNYQATPAYLHDICLAYLRLSQISLRHKGFATAYKQAKNGLSLSFSDKSTSQEYKIYYLPVIVVSSLMLAHHSNPVMDDYCEKFVQFKVPKNNKSSSSYERALALSQLSDSYSFIGQYEKSASLLECARLAWLDFEKPEPMTEINPDKRRKEAKRAVEDIDKIAVTYAKTGKCGPYNAAIATFKIGKEYIEDGQINKGLPYITESEKEFEHLLGPETLIRAKVLFYESDCLWKKREYIQSQLVKAEAAKIWEEESKKIRRRL